MVTFQTGKGHEFKSRPGLHNISPGSSLRVRFAAGGQDATVHGGRENHAYARPARQKLTGSIDRGAGRLFFLAHGDGLNKQLDPIRNPVCMSGESEKVLGEIPVIARLALGGERLALFVTETRIIVAHIGKRGTGNLVAPSLLGRLGGGLEDLLKSGKESRDNRALQHSIPEKILAADKDNFDIGYDEIVSARAFETPFARSITLVTRDDKFDFRTNLTLESIAVLLEKNLGAKLTVETL